MMDGPLVYYKLTLWAFGSGELKIKRFTDTWILKMDFIFFFQKCELNTYWFHFLFGISEEFQKYFMYHCVT